MKRVHPCSSVVPGMSNITEVAAAVIERPGEFLLAQRPEGKPYPGYWEFPGGKIEPGEDAHAALVRELAEELGIGVREASPWITRVYAYTHATVRLHFFRVTRWDGDPLPARGSARRLADAARECAGARGARAARDHGDLERRRARHRRLDRTALGAPHRGAFAGAAAREGHAAPAP